MNNRGETTMFSLIYFYLPFSCKTKDDTHKHNKQCYRKTDPVDKDDVSVRDFPEHLLNASLTTSGSVKKTPFTPWPDFAGGRRVLCLSLTFWG